MEITDIKIRKTESDSRMLAVVSIVLDSSLAVHDIKIIEAGGKIFLAMPAKRSPDGRYRDIVHPVTREMRDMLEQKVLKAYSDVTGAEL